MMWPRSQRNTEDGPHLKKGQQNNLGERSWPELWKSSFMAKGLGLHKKYSFNSKSNPRFTTVGAKHGFKYRLAMVPTPLYFFSTCIFFPVFSIFICSLEYSLWFNRYRIWFNLYRIQEGKQETAESTEEPVWCQAELAILGSSSHPLSSKAPYKFTALHTWFDHLLHAYFSFEDCT